MKAGKILEQTSWKDGEHKDNSAQLVTSSGAAKAP
jgi:hypothetical protein